MIKLILHFAANFSLLRAAKKLNSCLPISGYLQKTRPFHSSFSLRRVDRVYRVDPKGYNAFKFIFGSERNRDITVRFVNDVLGLTNTAEEITELTFLNSFQQPDGEFKKLSVVDVTCKDSRGYRYILTMQISKRNADFEKRIQYYAAKLYTDQASSSYEYANLKRVIFIGVVNFYLFPKIREFFSEHVTLDLVNQSHCLEEFRYTFLELPKFTKNKDAPISARDKWAYFFICGQKVNEVKFRKVVGDDKVLLRAYHELNYFGWPEPQRFHYEDMEKNRREYAYEIKNAEMKGKMEAQKLFAKDLLNYGEMSVDKIATLTRLPVDIIKKLKEI